MELRLVLIYNIITKIDGEVGIVCLKYYYFKNWIKEPQIILCNQIVDIRGKKELGIVTEEAYRIIRDKVKILENDRIMYTDINKVEEIVRAGEIVSKVETK